MAGNVIGGRKAAKKNIAREEKFYQRIGHIGGKKSQNGGFASDVIGKDGLTGKERARLAGKKGGKISRRGKAIN